MSVVSAVSLSYEVFIRSVALVNGVLFIVGACMRDTSATSVLHRKNKPTRPLSLPRRIFAFLAGSALLLVAFGVLK
jgi:hypothetical protein